MKLSVIKAASVTHVASAAATSNDDQHPNVMSLTPCFTRAGETRSTDVASSVSQSQTIQRIYVQQESGRGRTNHTFSIDTLMATEPQRATNNNLNGIKIGRASCRERVCMLV